MRVARFFVHLVGWLLTPFIAWAASFLGAILGAIIASRFASPTTGLIITAVCGAIAGFGTLAVVIHYLRRSPRLRQALHVTEDAIPDTSEFVTERVTPTPTDGQLP
jgi:hypothetical protein